MKQELVKAKLHIGASVFSCSVGVDTFNKEDELIVNSGYLNLSIMKKIDWNVKATGLILNTKCCEKCTRTKSVKADFACDYDKIATALYNRRKKSDPKNILLKKELS